jgi:hypothetical protein
MTYAQSLPIFTVEFSQLNDLAKQLRQIGAKFSARTDSVTKQSVVSFKVLPQRALKLLGRQTPTPGFPAIADPWEAPLETALPVASVVAPPVLMATPLLLPPARAFASKEQLQASSKTRLKKLAKTYGIQGRSQMDIEQLVAALVGKVPAADL